MNGTNDPPNSHISGFIVTQLNWPLPDCWKESQLARSMQRMGGHFHELRRILGTVPTDFIK
jgi:hypothetical protein